MNKNKCRVEISYSGIPLFQFEHILLLLPHFYNTVYKITVMLTRFISINGMFYATVLWQAYFISKLEMFNM